MSRSPLVSSKTLSWSRLLLGLVAVPACLDPFAPPPGTYQFAPPPVYQQLWQSVKDCSGLRGEFGVIQWYVVPGDGFRWAESSVNGVWKAPHNIYLSEHAARDSVGGYFTARHEMLHELVGKDGHPPVFARCRLLRT